MNKKVLSKPVFLVFIEQKNKPAISSMSGAKFLVPTYKFVLHF